MAEYSVVAAAVRSAVSGTPAGGQDTDLDPELNWDYIKVVAGYHGVQPLLFSWLKQRPESIDQSVTESLRNRVNARAANSLFLFQELGRLSNRMDEVGIRCLALKGATLAQQIYGSIALRPFVDIDLLIHPADQRKVDAYLTEEGFSSHALSPIQKRLYYSVHRQYSYAKYTRVGTSWGLTPIDLHTAIMPPGYSCTLPFDVLWSRARSSNVFGANVPVPGREDLLLILCYHGFKNRWDRLKYVCDVGMTIRKEPDLDWTRLMYLAQKSGGRRMVLLGALLAHDLVGAPVPEAVLDTCRSEPRIVRLAEEIAGRLPQQAHMRVEPYIDRLRLNLFAQDGLPGQARYVLYSIVRRAAEAVIPEADPGSGQKD